MSLQEIVAEEIRRFEARLDSRLRAFLMGAAEPSLEDDPPVRAQRAQRSPPSETSVGRLLEFVKANPGCYAADMAQHLGVTGGDLTYQSARASLLKARRIYMRGSGHQKTYYATEGDPPPKSKGGRKRGAKKGVTREEMAQIAEKRRASILAFLTKNPDSVLGEMTAHFVTENGDFASVPAFKSMLYAMLKDKLLVTKNRRGSSVRGYHVKK